MDGQPVGGGTGKRDTFLATSILVAALVVGGSLIYSAGVKGGAAGLAQVQEATGNAAVGTPTKVNVSADDDVILGDPKAPVTFLVFGDYQCPFCGATSGFNEAVIGQLKAQNPNWQAPEPNIIKEYVTQGKVKMVYRDFPLDQIHPFARPAAEAAECARDQGKYWAYHDYLFSHQASLATLDFVAAAGEVGMNEAVFKGCVDGKKYAAEVQADYEDGVKAGVNGTPGNFIIGKDGKVLRALPGAQSYEVFKAAIEEALKA